MNVYQINSDEKPYSNNETDHMRRGNGGTIINRPNISVSVAISWSFHPISFTVENPGKHHSYSIHNFRDRLVSLPIEDKDHIIF